jgi:predicted GNAT family acetyltransferase
MQIELSSDPVAFSALVGDFLAARLERNLLATVLSTAGLGGPAVDQAPLFAAGREDGELVAVALRTPPRFMLATGFGDQDSATALLDAWLQVDLEVPGIGAEPATAEAVAAAWQGVFGGRVEVATEMAMHSLSEVIPPAHQPAGGLRRASEDEHELVLQWVYDFFDEVRADSNAGVPTMVERSLNHGRAYLWYAEQGPGALVMHAPTLHGLARIGPVYTPPALRGHGYATAATAALSQVLLDGGAERCTLFTDLANPISNKIYASIGYVRFGDWRELRFVTPAERAA